MSPRVSFVVACFNHGEFLDEAVDSVLAQTVQDFEIVIVNDGSTDEPTTRLLAAYDRPKTRVVHTPNQGLSAARNTGTRATTGGFLCMLDADDRLEPTYLERSLAAFADDPELAFVSHWFRTFGDEEWEWMPDDCTLPALLAKNTVNGAALVRRSVLEAVGGFDESMREGCEDWDLWISATERGFRGHIVPEFLFQYRRRADSMSRVMLANDGASRLYARLIEKHRGSFEAHLPVLLGGHEADWARLRQDLDEIELDLCEWTLPALDHARDNARMRSRRAARRRPETGRLEAELADVRSALDEATREALKWHAEASRSAEMLAGISASASWRVTAPARWLWSVIAGTRSGRRRR